MIRAVAFVAALHAATAAGQPPGDGDAGVAQDAELPRKAPVEDPEQAPSADAGQPHEGAERPAENAPTDGGAETDEPAPTNGARPSRTPRPRAHPPRRGAIEEGPSEPGSPEGAGGPPVPPAPPAPSDGERTADPGLRAELEELRSEVRELKRRLGKTEEDVAFERKQRTEQLRFKVGGYLDFGFSYVGGNGSGIRADVGREHFPEFEDEVPASWVFMGDPLSTAVNARGEPADTSESRAVVFDSLDTRGEPSFALNVMNLDFFAGLGEDLSFTGRIHFVPRYRDISDREGVALGDFIDLQLAYAQYRVPLETPWFQLELFAGKFDSVLGVEYRTQEAPARLEVTPSLICRYTCGRPLGLKARARFLEGGPLALNVAVTNGSHFIESFPFSAEQDTNAAKTVAGRLSYELPIGQGVELGASGAFGRQDVPSARAKDLPAGDDADQWHVGVDMRADWDDLQLAAEFVQGKAAGLTEPSQARCGLAPCLEYKGAYGRVGYRFTNWVLPYVRLDWRDALHRDGSSFVYISKLLRLTTGMRLELGSHVVAKAEYTVNRELGRIPQFSNDVVATALVVKF